MPTRVNRLTPSLDGCSNSAQWRTSSTRSAQRAHTRTSSQLIDPTTQVEPHDHGRTVARASTPFRLYDSAPRTHDRTGDAVAQVVAPDNDWFTGVAENLACRVSWSFALLRHSSRCDIEDREHLGSAQIPDEYAVGPRRR